MSLNINVSKNSQSEVKFQHYASSRDSVKLITTKGKKITFVNFQYITCDKDCIEYLNDEIDRGLNMITKGKLMTAEEADPMASLKKRHIEEYLATQAETKKQEALGISPDMGRTKAKGAGINPMSSKGMIHAGMSSSSAAATPATK